MVAINFASEESNCIELIQHTNLIDSSNTHQIDSSQYICAVDTAKTMKTANILAPLLAGISAPACAKVLRGDISRRQLVDPPITPDASTIAETDALIRAWNDDNTLPDEALASDNLPPSLRRLATLQPLPTTCGSGGSWSWDKDQLSGSCDCDETGYTTSKDGMSCEEIDYEIKVIAVGVDPGNIRNGDVESCDDSIQGAVEEIEHDDEKHKWRLHDVTYIDAGFLGGQCGDDDYDDEIVRAVEDENRRKKVRHLKKDSSSKSRSGDDEKAIIVGAVGNTRTLGSNDCLDELEDAARRCARRLSASELEDLDGEIFFILDGECEEDIICDMMESAASSSSSSSSR